MQTNLTIGDGILSLLLGVAGSLIAAWLFLHAPKWISAASTLWAERSQRASAARIKDLIQKIEDIDQFGKSPAVFIGWATARVGRALLYCFLGVFLFLNNFAAKADYSLDIILVKLGLRDPSYVWGTSDERMIVVMYNGSIVASLILFSFGCISLIRLGQYSNLEKLRKELEAEIKKLRER